jgi:hypothetical protein
MQGADACDPILEWDQSELLVARHIRFGQNR